MKWSVHEMPICLKKVLSAGHVRYKVGVRPVLDVLETLSLYDIRLNLAKDLTAARGFMGFKRASLPNFGMESSVLEMLLNSATPQKPKKVLSDGHVRYKVGVRPVLDVHETQSLYNIRLNPAEDLTAARGIMGFKRASLPNFAMKKDSSDPHQNTVTQNALLLAPYRRCQSMGHPLNFTLNRNDTSDSS